MKKTIIIIIALIIILGGAYFIFNKSEKGGEETTDQVGAKINIDAVCEGALSYMTFPDGASADKFVQECKDGQHPEVIEKYKADMDLGEGASI